MSTYWQQAGQHSGGIGPTFDIGFSAASYGLNLGMNIWEQYALPNW